MPVRIGASRTVHPAAWPQPGNTTGSTGSPRFARKVVHKFGHNGAVGSTWEDVWTVGGAHTYSTAAFRLSLKSNSTADLSSSGACARTVTVEGLGTDWKEKSSTYSLNGTTLVTSSTGDQWTRVHRVFVATAGAYAQTNAGSNTGTITLWQGTSTTAPEAGGIAVDNNLTLGQSQVARYTVPADYQEAYVHSVFVEVESNKAVDLAFFQRQNADTVTAPYSAKRLIFEFNGMTGSDEFIPDVPLGPYPAKTDLWFATRAAAAASVSVDFEVTCW